VERFPDGAWVFYRLTSAGRQCELVGEVLARINPDDPVLARDRRKLDDVQAERSDAAQAYFAEHADHWDQIRSLYVSDADVEAEILGAAGRGRFRRMVDLGAGTGRMLTLLASQADHALGLDLSQQMLNIARRNVAAAGLAHVELRHGDIFDTRLPDASADLVVVHQVLHYLGDPAAAVKEAARIVAPDGRLIIVDFAPHKHEFLREQHQHRRLGFSDEEMGRWLAEADLPQVGLQALPPTRADGLTVKIWAARRASNQLRSAA
jgi:ArsR family transcriptional regulator